MTLDSLLHMTRSKGERLYFGSSRQFGLVNVNDATHAFLCSNKIDESLGNHVLRVAEVLFPFPLPSVKEIYRAQHLGNAQTEAIDHVVRERFRIARQFKKYNEVLYTVQERLLNGDSRMSMASPSNSYEATSALWDVTSLEAPYSIFTSLLAYERDRMNSDFSLLLSSDTSPLQVLRDVYSNLSTFNEAIDTMKTSLDRLDQVKSSLLDTVLPGSSLRLEAERRCRDTKRVIQYATRSINA